MFHAILKQKGINTSEDYVFRVVNLVRDRVNFVHEIWNECYFFFEAPESFDEQVVQKRWKPETAGQIREIVSILDEIDPFEPSAIDMAIKEWIIQKGYNTGAVMNAIRLLLVGTSKGPHLSDIMHLVGRKETTARLQKGITILG